jgi:hypothetical protein
MTQLLASDSPRPIFRFSPKRVRFDAVAHDAIMAVSGAFGGQRGRVGGRRVPGWYARTCVKLPALKRPKLVLHLPIADPTLTLHTSDSNSHGMHPNNRSLLDDALHHAALIRARTRPLCLCPSC